MKLDATTHGARVLVVDDDPDAARSLEMLLKLRGFTVKAMTDSTQCLLHLEHFKTDVVLLDIGMPKISGYDLAAQIRMRPEFASVAIVAISGYADKRHVDQSIAAGCDHHLVKPVELASIEAAISQEIEKRQPHCNEPAK